MFEIVLTIALLAIRLDEEERVSGVRLVGLFVGLAGVVLLLGIDATGSTDELAGVAVAAAMLALAALLSAPAEVPSAGTLGAIAGLLLILAGSYLSTGRRPPPAAPADDGRTALVPA